MENSNKNYVAKAFLSCSLRSEDRKFVILVSDILKSFNIQPFGTVGMLTASPENTVTSMKKNIELSDFVVVAATKRYFTRDNHTGKESNTLSEMVHSEIGMAEALNKPIVVFVKKGTNVGSLIKNITQYIYLDGTQINFDSQKNMIFDLLNKAYLKSQETKKKESFNSLKNLLIGGLAVYGGLSFFSGGYEDD